MMSGLPRTQGMSCQVVDPFLKLTRFASHIIANNGLDRSAYPDAMTGRSLLKACSTLMQTLEHLELVYRDIRALMVAVEHVVQTGVVAESVVLQDLAFYANQTLTFYKAEIRSQELQLASTA